MNPCSVELSTVYKGVGNLRPAGQLRSADLFHAARRLTARLCIIWPAPAILLYKITFPRDEHNNIPNMYFYFL